MQCKTCSHPQRPAIDLALLAENHTFESLSQRFGLSISSLFRHKQHLVKKMRRSRRRLQDSQAQVSLLKLNAILDHVQHAVRTAATEGKIDSVFKGSHVGSRIIHQINKMEVPLELDTVYRLISSPQWLSQDSLFPTDPQIITGIHQDVVDTVFLPCPELNLESLEEDDDDDDVDDDVDDSETETEDDVADWRDDYEKDAEDSEHIVAAPATDFEAFLKTGKCRTETELKLATALQQLLHRLDLNVDSIPATAPKNQREITEKLPKNFTLPDDNFHIYQCDSLSKKIFAKNLLSPLNSSLPAAGPTRNSEVDTRNSSYPFPSVFSLTPNSEFDIFSTLLPNFLPPLPGPTQQIDFPLPCSFLVLVSPIRNWKLHTLINPFPYPSLPVAGPTRNSGLGSQ